MSEYPEWLIRMVAEAGARGVDAADLYSVDPDFGPLPQEYITEWEQGAVAIMEALHFAPEYHAWKRCGKDRLATLVWEGGAVNPDEKARRRKALDELSRLSDELGEE